MRVPHGRVTMPDGTFDMPFYRRMHALVQGWQTLDEIPADRLPNADDRAACERLLHLEARLIDGLRLEAWLALFTEDCAYWIPADVAAADPARFVSWEFNDRRRLEERVERLEGGRAFSQIPVTRTTHIYSNIEMLTHGQDGMEVLCNFLIQANLLGRVSQRAGWNGFLLRRTEAGWRIVLKRVGLFDADLSQHNNSFTL
jgi:3-phenylpropionate/cinnamic acid dioxygenase small subunit